jgi:RNA polymerase sigma factor (sigma-70 family)
MDSRLPIIYFPLQSHSFFSLMPLQSSDETIIRRFIEGESAAYSMVVRWIRDVVNARVWVEGVSAEDITADTTEKLLVNLRAGRFKFDSSLKAYVQQITRFTIVNAVRSHRRAQTYLRNVESDPAENETPELILERKEEVLIFHRIFGLVDERCKAIWHLIFKEQLLYNQIAQRLHMSEGAVKTKVFRCKEEAIRIRNRIS